MLYDRKRWEPKMPVVTKPRVKPKPWQTVLRKAASYIKTHGWVRGTLSRGDKVCILGAMRAVGGIGDITARTRFEQFVGCPTAHWNDNVAKSAAEVIRKLRAAAKRG